LSSVNEISFVADDDSTDLWVAESVEVGHPPPQVLEAMAIRDVVDNRNHM
jgi:hypothetical protein